VWLVPNGVAIPQDPPAFSGDHKLLFVGSLNSLFNRQGLEWFLTEIWPHIRSRIPDSRFMLAGAGPKMSLPDGVAQLGFVEDLEPLYEQARVCIAPLHGGAGTRLKILEAMAHSRPVVTTTVGAEGISVSENDGVFIRDDAQAFARTCGELLTDDAASKDSGRNARERSAEFSWERIAQVAVESIKEVSRS
jgi:glycosyltransferase involved in cell wall biosynthesis